MYRNIALCFSLSFPSTSFSLFSTFSLECLVHSQAESQVLVLELAHRSSSKCYSLAQLMDN